MPAKRQHCRSTAVRVVRSAGSRRHPTTVLSGVPKSAKIYLSSETIWGNPSQYVEEGINMSKNKVGDSVSTPDKNKLNRRSFIKRSAAIGVGAGAFGTASAGPTRAQAITWDYEADVVVLGAGATGLPRPRPRRVGDRR
jgi:hypothetical protein